MKKEVFDLINNSKSIVLLTHQKPDGDATGSTMAMYQMLTSINKSVDIVLPEIPDVGKHFSSINNVVDKSDKNYDLAIVLDCANKERVGQSNNELDRCKKSVAIDHHVSNKQFCDINYVEESTAACCQVIYYLFKDWNIMISKEIGESLLIGLLTDTNGFGNNNVDKNSFLMAADMIDLGIDLYNIYYNVLSKRTMPQYLLVKMTLERLEFFHDGKIAFSYISKEDIENVGAKCSDHEGLVDLGRNIGGVEVSIFMREDNGYRVSLRSNGTIDVNKIAAKFGGGGHRMASGIKFNTNFKETKEILISEIIKEFSK